MISFTEFVRMKQQDMTGKDVKKTEIAAIRAIIECIKENERWVINADKMKLIKNFMKRLLEKGNGHDFGNQNGKKHKS